MATPDPFEFRTIDGTGNNPIDPLRGSAGINLLREAPSDYGDGISTPSGGDRPSARAISNAVMAQEESIPSAAGTSDFFWAWGQFLDHDIDLTGHAEPGSEETFAIAVPTGDPHFDPFWTGSQTIDLKRSGYDHDTGTITPREQPNVITAFIDASMVYGSSPDVAAALRDVGGKMKTSEGDMLPLEGGFFLGGDVRANENVALTSLHTIFVREHNRLVDELAEKHPELDDEGLYQHAKALVEAEVQAITYNEFLPVLLGKDALEAYDGYDPTIDPGIENIFATAAYRVGHTMLSSTLYRMAEDGSESEHGHLALRDAFFRPAALLDEGGVDPLLRGLAAKMSQEIDSRLVDDVRNFLFGPPGAGGFDLGSLNIQRGRDHGLPSYNEARVAYGLDPVADFDEITADAEIAQALEDVYGSVDKIDVFVGGIAEDHVEGAVVGALFHAILSDQFTRLRDGDRFWYEERFEGELLADLQDTTLAEVILDNSDIGMIQDNVFLAYNRIGGDETSERMDGTWDRDLMLGEGGHDRLEGHENDDQIHGGWGNDKLFGGSGNDKLVGDEGRDKLMGEDGDDHAYGGEGNDVALGGRGDDTIEGGAGRDKLVGGQGHDSLMGDAGRDVIKGDGGDDEIDGGSGRDLLIGGWGEDVILGGDGRDQLHGGWEADRLDGGGGMDALFGGAANDHLRGGAGGDSLSGGQGDDTLVGGEGADRMKGGYGDDLYLYEDVLDFGDKILDFNPHQDRLDLRPISDGAEVEVRLTERGSKTLVYAEVGGESRELVATLYGVDRSDLEVGSDPSANILV